MSARQLLKRPTFVPWDAIKDQELTESLQRCESERLLSDELLRKSSQHRKAVYGNHLEGRTMPQIPDVARAATLHIRYARSPTSTPDPPSPASVSAEKTTLLLSAVVASAATEAAIAAAATAKAE